MSWTVVLWYLLSGALLVSVGAAGPLLKKVWLSLSMFYLGIGLLMGPGVLDLLNVSLIDDAKGLEHLTEVAVVVSLFAAGLKMRMKLGDRAWLGPVVLSTATMTLTVGLVALLGWAALGLPLGMAVLLGAVLAPTDPVLASEVQVESPDDKDPLRLMLTGEAGLNDGTAFPFVLLAVGLVGLQNGVDLHDLGAFGWKWFVVDVGYKVTGGLVLGWLGGILLAKFAVAMRRHAKDDVGSDEMLSLGIIALVYGAALAIDTYAFLSVFAAALALRQTELQAHPEQTEEQAMQEAKEAEAENEADAPEHAPAILMRDQVEVADALERLVQVVLVVLTGSLLLRFANDPEAWLAALAILLIIRPVAVWLTLWRCGVTATQRGLVSWLGIRGIGTLYYLTHAFALKVSDVEPGASRLVGDVCLATITLSIILHGLSVTPLMTWYSRSIGEDPAEEGPGDAAGRAAPA